MVVLEEITVSEFPDYVRLGFGEDADLLNAYQQLDTDFETTVQRNVDNVMGLMEVDKLNLYKVVCNGIEVGFTVLNIEGGALVSFGINIHYRTKEIVVGWWNLVYQFLDGNFISVLWSKNKRAIEFLQRQGMRIFDQENDLTILIQS